jgi:hypothetical protein
VLVSTEHPSKHKKQTDTRQAFPAPTAVPQRPKQVQEMTWNCILKEFTPMLCEGHSYFVALQQLIATKRNTPYDPLLDPTATQISNCFRAILIRTSETLFEKRQSLEKRQQRTTHRKLADQTEINHQSDLLWIATIVWHFAEIFFVSSAPTSTITPQLVHWLNYYWHHEHLQQLDEVLSTPNPERQPTYWSLIHQYGYTHISLLQSCAHYTSISTNNVFAL